jgi:uncharacterized protein (TIGR00730 family)
VNVCVFCSANDLADEYVEAGRTFARHLAERGHTLIWGGTSTGLMDVIASGVQAGGGRIIGVSLELWREVTRADADEMVIAATLGERKAMMLERSDALAMLVGGLGTFDEITEVVELKRQGAHDKPIVILNTAGFYDGLERQLQRMEDEGFLSAPVADYLGFAATPDEAIGYLEARATPPPGAEGQGPSRIIEA